MKRTTEEKVMNIKNDIANLTRKIDALVSRRKGMRALLNKYITQTDDDPYAMMAAKREIENKIEHDAYIASLAEYAEQFD